MAIVLVLAGALMSATVPSGSAPLDGEPRGAGIGHPAAVAGGAVALVNHSAPDDDLRAGHFCGGYAVTSTQVVTAGHCIDGRSAATVDVLGGQVDLCAPHGYGSRSRVVTVERHPRQDIAVLTLRRPTGPVVSPGVAIGSDLEAIGWGRNLVGKTWPCTARGIRLTSVPSEVCGDMARTFNRRYESRESLCARPVEGAPQNTCFGDSGGPVIAPSGRAVGIVLWGQDCLPDSAGVYARIRPLRRWLQRIGRHD